MRYDRCEEKSGGMQMLSKVLSLGLSGVNGYEVQTEC